ncbi:glucan biosynthesis protein [Reyranella sp.]|uniref:glucan biosynthesis protein n=1 Tax=Reyranella sp. TaxID=1929291 RepID=UPI003D097729
MTSIRCRAPFLALALLLGLPGAIAAAQPVSFDFASVEAQAQKLASEPYRDVPSVEGDMRKLSYDKYRALRTKPDTALWRETKGLFRVEFFPAGFIYEKPVSVGIVEDGNVTPVIVGSGQFDFSDTGLKEPPKDIALAGFKITYPINRPDKFDEVISFLGASYFRPIGRNQDYGSSARGLAVDTATGRPEEFPTFRSFWLVKPADDSNELVVWALLDSPAAAGAFAFTVRPGGRTVVETKAVLFIRHDVGLLAFAPLTSMFFAGKASPPRDDYRPEIHDADGLFMLTGKGERIWRPLANPSALSVSSFGDTNPRGFGLLQRERAFAQYQDSSARLEARPSLWVEPEGDWGDGEVRLVEIPTQSETNDNIVAFWVSRWPAKQGSRHEYGYRLSALTDEAALSPLARVAATRSGAIPNNARARRVVVEFTGGDLSTLQPEQPVEANVSLSSGKLLRSYVEALPSQRSWRLFIDFEPDGKKPVDMRATLTLRGLPLTEAFATVHRP